MTAMIDRDALKSGPISYLGWDLNGAPGSISQAEYCWYATNYSNDDQFTVRINGKKADPDRKVSYEKARAAGLAVAKTKIAFGTWNRDGDYAFQLPISGQRSAKIVRNLVLKGLYDLYERGESEPAQPLENDGIALDIGVKPVLVQQAIKVLVEAGAVQNGDPLGMSRQDGYRVLTGAGVLLAETLEPSADQFVQEVYSDLSQRVTALEQSLGQSFEELGEEVAAGATSTNQLIGFAARVRDFVQQVTDRLYRQVGSQPDLPTEQTLKKVRAISQRAASETTRNHVRVLAEVVETHWTRLNLVQQKAVHTGDFEMQRLFTYTVLFLADLFEIANEPSGKG